MNKLELLEHIYANHPQIAVQFDHDEVQVRNCFGFYHNWVVLTDIENIPDATLENILKSLSYDLPSELKYIKRYFRSIVTGYAEEYRQALIDAELDHRDRSLITDDAEGAVYNYQKFVKYFDGEKLLIADDAEHRANLQYEINSIKGK